MTPRKQCPPDTTEPIHLQKPCQHAQCLHRSKPKGVAALRGDVGTTNPHPLTQSPKEKLLITTVISFAIQTTLNGRYHAQQ